MMSKETRKSICKQWCLFGIAAIMAAAFAAGVTGCNDNKSAASSDKSAGQTETKQEEKTEETANTDGEEAKKDEAPVKKEDTAVAAGTIAANPEVPAESYANYENFLKIKMGDSFETVTALLGDGEEISSDEVDGVKLSNYKWANSEKSCIALNFEDNVVVGKTQTNLTSMNSEVTLEKFNSVAENATYDEMVAALGEPEIMSENKMGDLDYITYQYTNKDKSTAQFTVGNGVVAVKTQKNLK